MIERLLFYIVFTNIYSYEKYILRNINIKVLYIEYNSKNMIPWIIQSGLISFILIFLIHYLFTFFKENLTVPKVIDLVNKPKEQYEDLMKNTNSIPVSTEPLLPSTKPDMSNMKNELKNYLRDLKAKTQNIPPSSNAGFPQSVNIMDTSNYSEY